MGYNVSRTNCYAKVTKDEIFVDHSSFLKPLIDTLDLTILNGINTSLYNFPLCTILRILSSVLC